jgi:putative transposase
LEDRGMPQKKHKPEEIVAKLRQVDVLVSQGRSVAEAVRAIGVTQFTYYRWRKEFGGLKTTQVKRLKELEKENERLRKAVSDLTLEKLILREAASGNFRAPPAAVPVSITSGRSSKSRNASPAGFSASTARPSGRCRAGVPTRTR